MGNLQMGKRIGIDIDGVVADFGKSLVDKFGKEKGFVYQDIKKYDLTNLGLSENEIKTFLEGRETYVNMKTIKGAREGVNKLSLDNQIIFISFRSFYPEIAEDTYNWLVKDKFKFDNLICFQKEKIKVIRKEGIELMIEDNPSEIDIISEEIPCIIYNQPWNQNIKQNWLLTKNIYRSDTWKDIVKFINKKDGI